MASLYRIPYLSTDAHPSVCATNHVAMKSEAHLCEVNIRPI